MSQYAYILVVISLVALFLINKYEKEKLQRLLQEQLLKDDFSRYYQGKDSNNRKY